YLFNLRFASKELLRSAKKCEKDEVEQKNKLKKAIQNNNMEGAKIYAETAIRKKNEALNYMRMSARIDAVSTRVQTATAMKKVTNSMSGVVRAMDSAMQSMNLEKVSALMDKFEKEFEDLDVQSKCMDSAMTSTTTITAPQEQIDNLMIKVADEAGIELKMELPGQLSTSIGTATATAASSVEQDELSQRLAKLRQS
ncbi:unnamed protein product, partial [Gordionus sp. m RMFG-2023]